MDNPLVVQLTLADAPIQASPDTHVSNTAHAQLVNATFLDDSTLGLTKDERKLANDLLLSLPASIRQELLCIENIQELQVAIILTISYVNQVSLEDLSNLSVSRRIKEPVINTHFPTIGTLDGTDIELEFNIYNCLTQLSELQLFFLENVTLFLSESISLDNFPNLSFFLVIAQRDVPSVLENGARAELLKMHPDVRQIHLRNGMLGKLKSLSDIDAQILYIQETRRFGTMGMINPQQHAAALFSKIIHASIASSMGQNIVLGEDFDIFRHAILLLDTLSRRQNPERALFTKDGLIPEVRDLTVELCTDWLIYALINQILSETDAPVPYNDGDSEKDVDILHEACNFMSVSSIDIRNTILEISGLDVFQTFSTDMLEELIAYLSITGSCPTNYLSFNAAFKASDNKTDFIETLKAGIYPWLTEKEDLVKTVNDYLISFVRAVEYFSLTDSNKVTVLANQQLSSTEQDGFADIILVEGAPKDLTTLTELSRTENLDARITLMEIKARAQAFPPSTPPVADLRQIKTYIEGLSDLSLPPHSIRLCYVCPGGIKVFQMSIDEYYRLLQSKEAIAAKQKARPHSFKSYKRNGHDTQEP